MSTLAEIESAADSLPVEQQQELLFYVAARLRAERSEAQFPRRFTKDEAEIASTPSVSTRSVRDFFGSYSSGESHSADNERIDADLVREAGRGL